MNNIVTYALELNHDLFTLGVDDQPMPIFDTHCHLDRIFMKLHGTRIADFYDQKRFMENFDNGPFEVLRKIPGLIPNPVPYSGCLHVITSPHFFDKTFWDWLTLEPNVYLALGCHPQDSMKMEEKDFLNLENSMLHPKVVALGEIGLDEVWEERGICMDIQKSIFKRQVQLAIKMQKPMILHLRGFKAMVDATIILEEEKVPKHWPIHLHAFTYSYDFCKKFEEEYSGMKFGMVANKFDLDVVTNLPLSKILLETDGPYFFPMELGTHGVSVPNYISSVAKEIAYIKGIELFDVLVANVNNAYDLYKIPCPPSDLFHKSEKSNFEISQWQPVRNFEGGKVLKYVAFRNFYAS